MNKLLIVMGLSLSVAWGGQNKYTLLHEYKSKNKMTSLFSIYNNSSIDLQNIIFDDEGIIVATVEIFEG